MNTYSKHVTELAYDYNSNATGSIRAVTDTYCVDCILLAYDVSVIAPLDAPQYLLTGSTRAVRNGYTRPGTIIRD